MIIIKIIAKVILSIILLYFVNLITINYNFVIPINIITIVIVTFLGFPGTVGLILLLNIS